MEQKTEEGTGVRVVGRVGLNVGSGQRPFHTIHAHTEDRPYDCTDDCMHWVNIDSQEKWQADLTCDGAHIPYPDQSVDYVVLHHVLEHFGCGEAIGLVVEAWRVLKPGGSLLVSVPDLRQLAVGWFSGKIPAQIYFTNVYGAYMGSEDDRHKWGYDAETLGIFLAKMQWSAMRYLPPQYPPGAQIARDWWILEMECVK